jgi:plastocyanin
MAPHPPTRRVDRRFALLLVVPVVAALAVGATFAFSSPSPVNASAGRGANGVQIQNFSFHPPTITVKPGSKVNVTNTDQTTHTFSAVNGSFDSGDLNGGASLSVTAPTKPGTYAYRCNIHQYMHGVLTVAP